MLRSFLIPPILAVFLACTACDVPTDPPETPDPPEQQPEEHKDTQPDVPKMKLSSRPMTMAALEPSSR